MKCSIDNLGSSLQPPVQYSAPPELREYRQFVAWRYEPNGTNKQKKCPIDPHTGQKADTTDPSTWGSFEDAVRRTRVDDLDGIGFVFTDEDPFAGIDLDDRVELYDRGRFFTLTGNKFGPHDVVDARQEQLEDFYYRTIKKDRTSTRHKDAEPPPGEPVDIPDSLLLQKARENSQTGERFVRLFDQGDATGYYSQSEADLALMKSLAFWTNRDKVRMIELFGESALGQRDKWKTREDYREVTADNAIKGCPRGYTPDPREVSKQTKEKLAELRDLAHEVKWLKNGRPNDLFVYLKLLEMVGRYGRRESKGGWRIIASPRDVSTDAGTTATTVRKSYERLEALGLISDIAWGKREEATRLTVHNPKTISTFLNPYHTDINTGGIYRGNNVSSDHTDPQASEPPTRVESDMVRIEETQISQLLRHVRNSSPTKPGENGKRVACSQAPLVLPIAPGEKLIIWKLSAKGPHTLAELARQLGTKRRDNLKRNLQRLLDEGFVVEEGGRYGVCDDIEDRLRAEIVRSNSIESEDHYVRKYARERRAHHIELREQEEERRKEEPKKLSTKMT
jgi:putative DNA primase/helicase